MTAGELIEPSADALPPVPPPTKEWGGLAWFALRTNPRCEVRAALGLREAGYEVFYPVLRRWVQHRRPGPIARKWRHVEAPLWPGYILVGLVAGQGWFKLRQCDGVHGPVSVEGVPLRLPVAKVKDVYAKVSAGEFDEDRRPRRRRLKAGHFKAGQDISIDTGTFAGLCARVKKTTKANAKEVLAELLASGQKVRVPIEAIKVESPEQVAVAS